MNKQGYALVGYHLADLHIALRLSADLKGRGVNVWMDRLDIPPGKDWMRMQTAALRDCAALVALLTPDYVTSPYGQNELESIYATGRPLIALLLRHVPASDWPAQVNYHQYVDFTHWQQEDFYQAALQELINQIEALPVVAVSGFVNPEKRYITQLMARIEQYRACFEYVRLSYKVETETQEQSLMRPPPRLEVSWGLNKPFFLRYAPLTDPRPIPNLEEALGLYPRLMLEGAPGIGKTTTLHRLVMNTAWDYLADPRQNPLPFLVSLAAWPQHLTFTDFLQSQWPFKSSIQERIARRDLALFLDGLDEIGAEYEARLDSLRAWLNSDQSPERVILTSASGVFPDGATLNLPVIRIEEMPSTRSAEFVRMILGEEAAETFWQQQVTTEHPARILHNPLLLRAALFVYQHSGDIPDAVAPLFLRVCELLWQREQILEGPDCPPYESIVDDLSALALHMVHQGSQALFTRESLSGQFQQAEVIDRLISSGIFFLTQHGLRFAHPLLQQALAARHFIQESVHPYLRRPVFDRTGQRIAQRYDSLIVLALTLLAQPDVILEEIADVDPFLALECLIAGTKARPVTQNIVFARLLQSVGQEYRAGASAAVDLLRAQSPEDPTAPLLHLLRTGAWELRCRANDLILELNVTGSRHLQETLNHWDGTASPEVAESLRRLGSPILLPLLHLARDAEAQQRRAALWALGTLRDPAALPSIVHALHDEDASVRQAAAEALKELPDAHALPELLPLLQDPSRAVRKSAIDAVASLGVTGVPDLRRWLRQADVGAQRMAVGALRHIGDPVVVPDLLDCLNTDDTETKALAVRALGEIGSPKAVAHLAQRLQDEDVSNWTQKSIGVMAAEALEQIGTEDAMAILQRLRAGKGESNSAGSAQIAAERMKLITSESPRPAKSNATLKVLEALRSPNERNRLWAIKKLSNYGKIRALSPLADALQDPSPRVRIAAVKALSSFSAEHVVEHLLDALRDPEPTVVEIAIQHLSQIGTLALPSLLDLLQSQIPTQRGLAAEILGAIGDAQAVPLLETLTRDAEIVPLRGRSVGDLALEALNRIRGSAADAKEGRAASVAPPSAPIASPEDLAKLDRLIQGLQSSEWRVRQDAAKQFMKFARMLREQPNPALIEPILSYLSIEDEFVRSAVVDALAYLMDPGTIPALRRLLNTSDWMQRIVILRALAHMQDPEAGQALIEALRDPQDRVRETAAEMLGHYAYEGAVPALRQALRDPAIFVRRFAIQSLGKLRASEAARDVLPFLKSASLELRATAVEALGRMRAAEAVPFLTKQLQESGEITMDVQQKRPFSELVLQALETIHTPEAQKAIQHYHARQGKR